ncbi:MAG: hypothetical protein V3V08_23720, partial [Nannocystaceae bacterium]
MSPVRATHGNDGAALAPDERPQGVTKRRAFRCPKLSVYVDSSDTTEIGGLALAARLAAKLRGPQRTDEALSLFKVHRGYFESDHVLTHAYNLFTGGTCIEDIAH